jgi:hypothetical protein
VTCCSCRELLAMKTRSRRSGAGTRPPLSPPPAPGAPLCSHYPFSDEDNDVDGDADAEAEIEAEPDLESVMYHTDHGSQFELRTVCLMCVSRQRLVALYIFIYVARRRSRCLHSCSVRCRDSSSGSIKIKVHVIVKVSQEVRLKLFCSFIQ